MPRDQWIMVAGPCLLDSSAIERRDCAASLPKLSSLKVSRKEKKHELLHIASSFLCRKRVLLLPPLCFLLFSLFPRASFHRELEA